MKIASNKIEFRTFYGQYPWIDVLTSEDDFFHNSWIGEGVLYEVITFNKI